MLLHNETMIQRNCKTPKFSSRQPSATSTTAPGQTCNKSTKPHLSFRPPYSLTLTLTRITQASYPFPANPETMTSTRKPQSVPWTHEGTIHLIQAYQEKWYSLNRASLNVSQWEEVAITVTARCGLADGDSKSATQCRHKMEKLRRRYRAERQGLGGASSWPYYHSMDELDRGPFPISTRALTLVPGRDDGNHDHGLTEDDSDINEENVDEYDVGFEDDDEGFSKSRSINYLLQRPSVVNRFSGFLQNPMKRQRVEEEVVGAEVRSGGSELAMEIRKFAERFAGIERTKMEIMRETERYRMEMESKRIEIILDSQRKIVDAIARSFGSPERLKMKQELSTSRFM